MIVWLPAAQRDRVSQLNFIAGENPGAAERIDDEIERQTALLLASPPLGRLGRAPGTRELVINRSPFVLVFRVRGKRVEILRLLHGAERWPGSRK